MLLLSDMDEWGVKPKSIRKAPNDCALSFGAFLILKIIYHNPCCDKSLHEVIRRFPL